MICNNVLMGEKIKQNKLNDWAAEQFQRAKAERKVTQTQLGEALGISQPQAASLLAGTRKISADEIPILENFFKVSYHRSDDENFSKVEEKVGFQIDPSLLELADYQADQEIALEGRDASNSQRFKLIAYRYEVLYREKHGLPAPEIGDVLFL